MAACRRRRRSSGLVVRSGLFVLALAAMPAVASAADDHLWTYHLRGTVGAASVGAILTLQDDHRFVAGHDFYADGTDVPLTGALDARVLELRELGGGTFHLHLANPPGALASKLDFGSDPRLEGTWTRSGDTRPVHLHVEDRDEGRFPSRLYGAVTREPDRRFEARVRRFVVAVLAGDETRASGFVSYPLRVDDNRTTFIRTRAELIRTWRRIFTPPVMAALRGAIPHDMIVNDDGDGVKLAEGVAWFNGRGVETINVD